MKCKTCGVEMPKIPTDTIVIKELGIEITQPKEWTKPYNEIVKPKGWRLPHIWELFQIHESKHRDFIFGEGGYLEFPCEQLSIDKENNWSRWLFRSRNLDLNARNVNLSYSYSYGRVVFVKTKR